MSTIQKDCELKIAGLVVDSIVDGPGLRVAIFLQGCTHGCVGCHNPESWTLDGGQVMSVDGIYDFVRSNPIARGVTFSGGEPFLQASGLISLACRLKSDGYELASYSGFTYEELISGTVEQVAFLEQLDILIDGRFEQDKKTLELPFRGSANQRIIDVQKSLKVGNVVISTSKRWNQCWAN